MRGFQEKKKGFFDVILVCVKVVDVVIVIIIVVVAVVVVVVVTFVLNVFCNFHEEMSESPVFPSGRPA